jgi:hypothetical protein
MSEGDPGNESFEERVRSIARELSRSVERMAQFDIDEIAHSIGVDPVRAREWIDTAGRWLSGQAESLGDDVASWGAAQRGDVADDDAQRNAGPHPLDLPTGEQGRALAALDSGRWTVEPGSDVIVHQREGPAPSDTLGLVGELRARDWIGADGKVTQVGHHALSRWLDASNLRAADPPPSDS